MAQSEILSAGEIICAISFRFRTQFFGRKSHIFDGKSLTKETAAFQLCDIVDPMLKGMIDEQDDLREEPDVHNNISLPDEISETSLQERDGWYTSYALERIKTVLRHKFFTVLEGYPATDEECQQLLTASEKLPSRNAKDISVLRSVKLKHGKHNMAKGAMRPEDAAVCCSNLFLYYCPNSAHQAMRLRATLDKNAAKARATIAED